MVIMRVILCAGVRICDIVRGYVCVSGCLCLNGSVCAMCKPVCGRAVTEW